jgi:hypothetical protein
VDDVWWPQLQFVNQQKIWPTLPEVVHIAADGQVYYRQRVWGPFSQPLDVREFPFDTQDFEIRVACVNVGTHEVVLEADPETPSGLGWPPSSHFLTGRLSDGSWTSLHTSHWEHEWASPVSPSC